MDYIKTLSDLIAIDTSVPPGNNYLSALNFLLPFFKETGCAAEIIPIPPHHAESREGRAALVCHRRNPGFPRLIFYAHVDVVPAQGWDAFHPHLKGDRLYGRGAADMKGGIISLLMALEALRDKPLKYDISVMVTTDEEFSQAGQIRYLRRFLEPVKNAAIFSLDSNFGAVAVASLGVLQLEIKVKGKSVHSGLSHLGLNAVEESYEILSALLNLKKRVTARTSAVETSPDTGLTHMVPRLNINMIHGGLKVNIVPDECTISVDRRLIPEENLEAAEKELMDSLKAVQGVDWEIAEGLRVPTLPAASGPDIERLSIIIKEITGHTGKYGEMGSGDLGVIVHHEWQGVDFGLGVIRTECNIHGKDEFVYLKDVESLSRIVAAYLSD